MSNSAKTVGGITERESSRLPWLAAATAMIRQRVFLIDDVVRSWEALLWISICVCATLLVLLRFEVGQNADGLIQTLMSLQHLTLFFWDQNRFANLLPLLASPIIDPITNAQAQLTTRIVLGLAAPLMFCAAFVRDRYYSAVRATVIATGLALAFAPHRFIHEWLIEASPYGTSYALAGFALLLFESAPSCIGPVAGALRLAGLALTVTAYLVNASLILFTGPLFALLAIIRGARLAVEFGIASIIGGIVTAAAAGAVVAPHTAMRFGETFIGVEYYLGQFSRKPGFFLEAMLGVFALCVCTARAMRWLHLRDMLADGTILVITFVVGFLAISLSSWVIANDLHPRYLVPLYILAASLGAISIMGAIRSGVAVAYRSRVALGLGMVLLVTASLRSLPPVPGDDGIVDVSVRQIAAEAANALTRLHLDGIAGDYWTVWPSVFLAEQRAHELGRAPGGVFGLSYRGDARREALRAGLIARGGLDLACLDLLEAECRALVSEMAGLPLSITKTVQARQQLFSGHYISAIRLSRLSGESIAD